MKVKVVLGIEQLCTGNLLFCGHSSKLLWWVPLIFLPKCQLPKHGYSGSNILKQFCSINKFPLSLGTSFNQGSTVELFLPFFHLLISLIPCLPPFPPIILQNPYTVITREFRDNIYAKFWGATKVHYGRCESGKLITFDMKATSSL